MEVEEGGDDGKLFKHIAERRHKMRVKCLREGENIEKCGYSYKIGWSNEYRNNEIMCPS